MRTVLSNADLAWIGRKAGRGNPLNFSRPAGVEGVALPEKGLPTMHGGAPLGVRGMESGASMPAGGGASAAATGVSTEARALPVSLNTNERPRVARWGNEPLAGAGSAEERSTFRQPTRPEPPIRSAPPRFGGTAAALMGGSTGQRPGAQLTAVYTAATAPLELEQYAAKALKGRKREEWAKALQREMGRLSELSESISAEIGRIEKSDDYKQELRNPDLFRHYPERSPRQRIQSLLAQIRGTDDDYRRNHGRPLPGTLNAQVEEIRRTLTAVTKADQARAGVKEVSRARVASPSRPITRSAKPGKIDALNLFPIAPPRFEQKAAVQVGELIPTSGMAQHERLSGAIRQAIAAGTIPAPPDLAPDGDPERKLQEQRLAKLRQVVEAYNAKLRQEHGFDVGGYRWGGPDEAAYVLNTTPWLELNARHGKRWNWQEFGSFAKAQGLGRLSDFDKKVLNAAINARRMEWLDEAVGKLRSEGEQVMEGALFVAAELFGMGVAPLVLRGLGIVGRRLVSSRGGQIAQSTLRKAAEFPAGQGVATLSQAPLPKPVARGGKAVLKALTPSEAKVQNALANMLQEGASAALEPDPEADGIISRVLHGGVVGYGGTSAFELVNKLRRGSLKLTADGLRLVRERLRARRASSVEEAVPVVDDAIREAQRRGQTRAVELMTPTRQEVERLRESLRNKTPSNRARSAVLEGQTRDFVTNWPFQPGQVITADHLVTFDAIIKMPGFGQLSHQQQLEVLDWTPNMRAVSKNMNSSRREKPFAIWRGHSKLGSLTTHRREQLIALEQDLERQIREMIRIRVYQNTLQPLSSVP